MNLRDYIFNRGLSHEEFAHIVKIKRVHLSCVVTGKRKPSKELAQRIEEETGGQITAENLLNGKASGYEGKAKYASRRRKDQRAAEAPATNNRIFSLI